MDRKRAPRLSLDLLRGFRAAARHLSFTRAAQELFVSQPAISREIKTPELRGAKGAQWIRFSHYDQVIEAALRGSGIAVGKLPHLCHHLQTGALVAPLGPAGVVHPGAFYIEIARSAQRDAVDPFIAWLHAEAERDGKKTRTVRSPKQ